MSVIIKNRIKCNFCGDIIESRSRHDYVTCKCGRVAVDGGHSYCKRSAESPNDYTDMSIFADEKELDINESEQKKIDNMLSHIDTSDLLSYLTEEEAYYPESHSKLENKIHEIKKDMKDKAYILDSDYIYDQGWNDAVDKVMMIVKNFLYDV